MADVLTFSDFWFLSLIPMTIQVYAVTYLWRLREYIGKKMTYILFSKNILLLTLYVLIEIAMYDASTIPGEQPLEFWGLYIDLLFPIGISVLFYFHLKNLESSLSPNRVSNPEERNRKRDMDRDANRDIERDVDRDVDRDIRRDLYNDRDKKHSSSGKEE